MRIIDAHFHWWPRKFIEDLCKRKGFPTAEPDGKGGFKIHRHADTGNYVLNVWDTWFHMDKLLEYENSFGHDTSVVNSIGPFSVHFSDLPADEGRDAAME